MSKLFMKTQLEVLEQGLDAMSKANQLLLDQNRTLLERIEEMQAHIDRLQDKVYTNREAVE